MNSNNNQNNKNNSISPITIARKKNDITPDQGWTVKNSDNNKRNHSSSSASDPPSPSTNKQTDQKGNKKKIFVTPNRYQVLNQDENQNHDNRFKYVQPYRRDLCKPTSQPTVSKTPFTEDTVYNHSYHEHDMCGNRPEPIMHKDHLVLAGKFQDQTSQKMSYPVQCISAVQKVVPKHSCLGFEGAMRFTTTQQHDYYVPCNNDDGFGRGKKTVRSDNLVVGSRLPMAKLTTSYCSYQPVCAKRQNNFKPNTW
ncbi:hypothetical protein ACI65C_001391 [Semiaphis heraclei]